MRPTAAPIWSGEYLLRSSCRQILIAAICWCERGGSDGFARKAGRGVVEVTRSGYNAGVSLPPLASRGGGLGQANQLGKARLREVPWRRSQLGRSRQGPESGPSRKVNWVHWMESIETEVEDTRKSSGRTSAAWPDEKRNKAPLANEAEI